MSSLISLFSNSLTAFGVYSQICNDPEFIKIVKRSRNKDSRQQLETFFRNILYQQFDEDFKGILTDEELNAIFENGNISNNDKVSFYVTEVMMRLEAQNFIQQKLNLFGVVGIGKLLVKIDQESKKPE